MRVNKEELRLEFCKLYCMLRCYVELESEKRSLIYTRIHTCDLARSLVEITCGVNRASKAPVRGLTRITLWGQDAAWLCFIRQYQNIVGVSSNHVASYEFRILNRGECATPALRDLVKYSL